MWWLLVTFAGLVTGYWLLNRPYNYWIKKGVKQGNPRFIIGDSWNTLFSKESFPETLQKLYNMHPNARYSGIYQFFMPALLVRDPDLIKQITIKDFDHFVDHSSFISEDSDPLWAKNLFALNGTKWREMRAVLSPSFTSSKMKYMFSLISKSSEQFVNYFLKKKEDVIGMEMKDAFTRFTNDVIANTAFGVECDSLDDKSNGFYMMGKKAMDFTGFWKNIKFLGFFLIPKIYKLFKVTLFTKEVGDFFTNIVKSNIASREKFGIIRPDMINLLLEARKNVGANKLTEGTSSIEESEAGDSKKTKMEISDEDIAAQAMIFFFGGFDSVSGLMSFVSYELAVNPDIQERLIQEIDETLEACKGQLTYEALLSMKYMDMVISETLRKWPTNVIVDRVCTKAYTIEAKRLDEVSLHLEKGSLLWLPFFAIHRDPQHYPDPDRFDPERFNDENKKNIKPYTYIPFGSGPRGCIGSRFALLETKSLFFNLLAHFQLVPVEKTQIPLVLSKKAFNMIAEKGFWLGLKRRNKTQF